MPKLAPPPMPGEGATADELGQTLADILKWVSEAEYDALIQAGLDDEDVMRLLHAASDYENDRLGPDTLATIHELSPLLNLVSIT